MTRELPDLLKYLKKVEQKYGCYSPVLDADEMTLLISVVQLAEADLLKFKSKHAGAFNEGGKQRSKDKFFQSGCEKGEHPPGCFECIP